MGTCDPVFLELCVCFSRQLQKHDREDEDVPSKWRSEAEMAAEASDLRDWLKKL